MFFLLFSLVFRVYSLLFKSFCYFVEHLNGFFVSLYPAYCNPYSTALNFVLCFWKVFLCQTFYSFFNFLHIFFIALVYWLSFNLCPDLHSLFIWDSSFCKSLDLRNLSRTSDLLLFRFKVFLKGSPLFFCCFIAPLGSSSLVVVNLFIPFPSAYLLPSDFLGPYFFAFFAFSHIFFLLLAVVYLLPSHFTSSYPFITFFRSLNKASVLGFIFLLFSFFNFLFLLLIILSGIGSPFFLFYLSNRYFWLLLFLFNSYFFFLTFLFYDSFNAPYGRNRSVRSLLASSKFFNFFTSLLYFPFKVVLELIVPFLSLLFLFSFATVVSFTKPFLTLSSPLLKLGASLSLSKSLFVLELGLGYVYFFLFILFVYVLFYLFRLSPFINFFSLFSFFRGHCSFLSVIICLDLMFFLFY